MTIKYFLILFGLLFFAVGICLFAEFKYIRPYEGIVIYKSNVK